MDTSGGERFNANDFACIYCLIDPDVGDVRYIGQASRPHNAKKRHLHGIPKAKRLAVWLLEMRRKKKRPIFKVMQIVQRGLANAIERNMIASYAEFAGDRLLNMECRLRREVSERLQRNKRLEKYRLMSQLYREHQGATGSRG